MASDLTSEVIEPARFNTIVIVIKEGLICCFILIKDVDLESLMMLGIIFLDWPCNAIYLRLQLLQCLTAVP